MSAYVISEVESRDAMAMESYRRLAAQSIAKYGGHYLVRGASAEVVEGAPSDASMVIVEFPFMARLRACTPLRTMQPRYSFGQRRWNGG